MTDEQIIRKFAGEVLRLYREHDCMDIDGGDMHNLLEQCGLIVPGVVDEADMDEEWPHDWDLGVGDLCDKYTDLALALINEGKQYAKNA